MKYEKTQHSNPYQLTDRQHYFPKGSIERFSNEKRKIHVQLIEGDKTILAPRRFKLSEMTIFSERFDIPLSLLPQSTGHAVDELEEELERDIFDKITESNVLRQTSGRAS